MIHQRIRNVTVVALIVLGFLLAAQKSKYSRPRFLKDLTSTSEFDYSQYVNPFMGSEGAIEGLAYGGGNIFVGAAVPFGVAKVGIDTYETNISHASLNGGFTPNGLVTGVSMMHESGTGGPPKYGIISQMPLTTLEDVNVLDNTTYWQRRVGKDVARVGYFSTRLENGVHIELSGGRHSGIIQYNFPPGEKHILVDVSHYLPMVRSSRGNGQYYSGGEMHLDRDGAMYMGWGAYGGGFSNSAPMVTFFCGEFKEPPDEAHTFKGPNSDPVPGRHTWANGGELEATFGENPVHSGGRNGRVGANFTWSEIRHPTVRSRIGISMVSVAKACKFKDTEIASWQLNDTADAVAEEWNRDVFSKVRVPIDESQNRTNLALLYSSLYFTHLMPSNRKDENILWLSEDSWDDFYALWDTFRCTMSLFHLIQPTYYASMIRSLLEIYRFEGYLPDGRSGNYNGVVQGGSNADNVLADAYVKGLPDVNWTEAFHAVLKDAEVTPYNQFNPLDLTGDIQQGRGALDDWKSLGYIADDHHSRSISRTVEYSLNDYSFAIMSRGRLAGDPQKYMRRSAQWQNLWNHDVEHQGFTGFLAPRLRNGSWKGQDDYNPAVCDGGCGWSSSTYEGTPFEYSFNVPHDMQTLIQFMGGKEEFERRLDYVFTPGTREQNLGVNGLAIDTIMNIGNEPDFATPYHYNYINKQHKSVKRSRTIANKYFHNTNNGLPGNSDAGALNSWLIWQMLGLYPIATQPVYLLGSPWFSEINITLGADKTLHIKANNLDNRDSYYVQAVRVNGRPWGKNWLEHQDVMVEGGSIEFDLGPEEKVWERGNVPPSPGHLILANN